MANPTAQLYPISRDGKPINIGDTVTMLGIVTASTGYGSADNATITVSSLDGDATWTVGPDDIAASTQTL